MKRSPLLALLAVAALAALPAASMASEHPAPVAQPRASLPDIEDEVMCPTCGVPLNLAGSPQAERQREFIRAEIERGRTKAQIKDALVGEFGPGVLALPDPGDSSFNWAAYLVPIGAVLAALATLAVALPRWRRREAPAPENEAEPSAAEVARLDQDLSRYDV